jgi:hypothetical protein
MPLFLAVRDAATSRHSGLLSHDPQPDRLPLGMLNSLGLVHNTTTTRAFPDQAL